MLTFNPENQTYSKLIHIDEFPEMQKKMKQISSRVEYKPFDEIPDKNQLEDYHVTIDDANSLEKMFTDNPSFRLESPMDIMRRTILLISCGMSEDTEGIEYLINKGAEINRNDLFGENALMYVIQNQNMPTEEKLKAVQLLIDHGIDVNWANSHCETALMMALNQIEIEVAELLIDNGGVVYLPPRRPKEPDTNE